MLRFNFWSLHASLNISGCTLHLKILKSSLNRIFLETPVHICMHAALGLSHRLHHGQKPHRLQVRHACNESLHLVHKNFWQPSHTFGVGKAHARHGGINCLGEMSEQLIDIFQNNRALAAHTKPSLVMPCERNNCGLATGLYQKIS